MKQIKNIFILILVLALVLTGCGASKTSNEAKEPATESAVEAPSSSTDESPTAPSAEVTESVESSATESDFAGSADEPARKPESSSKEEASSSESVPTSPDTMGEPPKAEQPRPSAGILTAGEWNDNDEFAFLLNLMQKNRDYQNFASSWNINVSRRIVVRVTDGKNPIANAEVNLITYDNRTVWTAKTNNKGMAYIFNGIGSTVAGELSFVRAKFGGEEKELAIETPSVIQEFSFKNQTPLAKSLDLSLVIDTTGSMGDELSYLKEELKGVVERVSKDNANIPIRTAVTVYRDNGDQYVVRNNYLNDNIDETINFISKQQAGGGGDWEEAVEEALEVAINDQTWNKNATARIILLVLDAPPHNTKDIQQKLIGLMEDAAEAGVIIIPVASSGIDKTTEFLLRSMAVSTGGTYVFLTDDSGVGNAHIEPTIGQYQVEYLDDLLVRVINEYVG